MPIIDKEACFKATFWRAEKLALSLPLKKSKSFQNFLFV
jgi:hypothetical protein